MTVEWVAVGAVVLMAMAWASWRVYRLLNGQNDPCEGCELKKNCQKFGGSKEK